MPPQSVTFTGPFFAKDPAKTLRNNIRDMLEEIAETAEREVRQQLSAGEGSRATLAAIPNGRVSHFVRGRVASLTGKPWKLHAVISPDTSRLSATQAISVMAAASKLERRTHAFARTSRAIRAGRKDLAKGLE